MVFVRRSYTPCNYHQRNSNVEKAMSKGQHPNKAGTEEAAELARSAEEAEDLIREWLSSLPASDGAGSWSFEQVGFMVGPWPHMYGVSPDGICKLRSCGLEVKEVDDADFYDCFVKAVLADESTMRYGAVSEFICEQKPGWWGQVQLGMAVTGYKRWAISLRLRTEKEKYCVGFVPVDARFICDMLDDIRLVQLFRDAMSSILELRDGRVLNGRCPLAFHDLTTGGYYLPSNVMLLPVVYDLAAYRPNSRRVRQTGCSGELKVALDHEGAIKVTSLTTCDGSHTSHSIRLATIPDARCLG